MTAIHFSQATSVGKGVLEKGLVKQHQGDRGSQQPSAGRLTAVLAPERVALAQRSSATADVTLLWQQRDGVDAALVCVCDRETGGYFEIPAEPYLALDIYRHPYAYRDFSTVDQEGGRLADTSASAGARS